ncbi:long-chain-fatty-acid--CoA ligase [Aeromicrobium senzhongii]|uniref:Long-chain-fatty-acid--CoA ligase n=1 Tax=Aeromicrobium senzhongii TaxID=2663859 RepID=A0ABX6SU36_9ACTN|nr:long-chain-fatty-acid--CoA ligase [Aeromicrobium senzhongii]MTB88084.1 long-chain-fatty-acid--CoA ligase [Aeromicrobium senzhongii]QNL94919.1 long-chain-fatty-acid--CoA ligase [Aeromicrobium senzhongii]
MSTLAAGLETHGDGSPFVRLEDVVRRSAAHDPEGTALIEPGRRVTFAELDASSNRFARALLADGVQPGDRVCHIGENSAAFFDVLYGAGKAGAIPVPMNFRLAPPEVLHIVEDVQPRVVVLGAGMEHHGAAIAAVPGVARVVTVEPADGLTDLSTWTSEQPATDPGIARDPEDTAVMFYTSGTTGRPKGIELTGVNVSSSLACPLSLVRFDRASVALAPVPFFHVTGFGLALMANLKGSALLMINPQGPADLLRVFQEYRVSHGVLVPTVIQFMLDLPESRTGDWSALRCLMYGGAPMPESVLRDATDVFGCDFIQGYGLTESTGGVAFLAPEDHRTTPETVHRLRSVGRVRGGNELRVIDPRTGADQPPGERGEVLVRGGNIMKRYWNRPEETAAAIDADGWLHTGDGGSLDADGYLYLHDRLKDMIVSGGENVYPAEVESVLTAHPGVAQVAVIGVPSDRWGESPMAIVVRSSGPEGAALDAAAVIGWARERLAHYKCPVDVAFVDALPLNASGKLLKARLREEFAGS